MTRAAIALTFYLSFPQFLHAARDPATLCIGAAQTAAEQTDVPLQVLLAVTLTETGRDTGAGVAPWPWALNHNGESLWFQTKEEAAVELERLMADSGSLDIGCYQLNQRWHGARFPSSVSMLDPAVNALYAANFLDTLYLETGDWSAAVGAYHSRSPELAQKYLDRYQPIYDALTVNSTRNQQSRLSRANQFPLLQAGEGNSLGSLVPARRDPRPLIGG